MTMMDDAAAIRPNLTDAHHVANIAETEIAVPLPAFDAWFQHVALEDILPGYGTIPRIVRSDLITGVWSDPGARRRVHMADGTSVLEEVLAQDRPHHFSYMVWDFPGVIGTLASYANGEFFTTAAGEDATAMRWRYRFRPRGRLATPVLKAIVATQFRPFMQVCIDTIKSVAEQEYAKATATRAVG